MVEAQVSYKSPARYDDLLVVETVVTRIGRASVRFEYRVVRGESLLATGHTIHACVNGERRRCGRCPTKWSPLPEALP